jgi:hypothetical protein
MANVFRKGEVSLNGTFYPYEGKIQKFNAADFEERQVFGDYTKDDQEIASVYIPISDQRGGLGVYDAKEQEHADRFLWSTAETGIDGHLLLPPLVTSTTNPTTADPGVGCEYNNELYWAFGAAAYKWAEGSSTWGSSLVTLNATPTFCIVHKSKLYFASDIDFDRFDGTSWTDGAALGSAQPSRYFVEWDGKLFSLDNTGQLDYTIDEGVTWITSAKSNLADGSFNSLFVYRNAAGAFTIHLGTKVGMFALDFDTATWIETDLEMPFHDFACLGANRWYGSAYIPNGGAIIRATAGMPLELTPVGPDQDYGLLSRYRGNIIKVIPGQSHLFALIDATSALAQDVWLASFQHSYGNVTIQDNVGFSALLKSDSLASDQVGRWSVVYLSGSAALAAKDAVIATADGKYRLWFAMDNKVYWTALKLTKTNPLEDSDHEFGLSSEHITSWFDADNAVSSKLAARIVGYVTAASSTEYIKVSYGTDYDDDTWTLLTNTSFSDGQIDSSGEAEFTLASGEGVQFRAIRFKVEHARGTASTKVSPDLHWLRLEYVKQLEPRYGFGIRLNCTRNYRLVKASTLLANLETAESTKTLMNFQPNDTDSHNVRILPLRRFEKGARKREGIFDAMLVAP